MKRRVLVVVHLGDRFVCTTLQEGGQMRMRIVEDWLAEVRQEAEDISFRVLVPPLGWDPEEQGDSPYFVWNPEWSRSDQDFWLNYLQDALKSGYPLPDLLLLDLDFLTKCLQSRGGGDWSSVLLSDNQRFARLYSVLLGFKALHNLRSGRSLGVSVKDSIEEASV